MNINLLLPALLLLAAWRAWRGFKNGLAEEIYRLISLVAALFVLALVIMAVRSDEIKNGVISVILLIIIGILLHLFGIIMKSLKAIVKLPIISFLNSVLGLAAGIAEIIVTAWIMYCVIQTFPTGEFGRQIMVWTQESEWLTKLYEANRITEWLRSVASGSF